MEQQQQDNENDNENGEIMNQSTADSTSATDNNDNDVDTNSENKDTTSTATTTATTTINNDDNNATNDSSAVNIGTVNNEFGTSGFVDDVSKSNKEEAVVDSSSVNNNINVIDKNKNNVINEKIAMLQGFIQKYVPEKYITYIKNNYEFTILPCLIGFISCIILLAITGKLGIVIYYIVYPIYTLIKQIIGIALGVGLGLGLATHIYERLEFWTDEHNNEQYHNNRRRSSTQQQKQQQHNYATNRDFNNNNNSSNNKKSYFENTKTSNAAISNQLSTLLLDNPDDSYAALMASAGYPVVLYNTHSSSQSCSEEDTSNNTTNNLQQILRGQVLYKTSGYFHAYQYQFTDRLPPMYQLAPIKMQQLHPLLPKQINYQLGRFIEHIMRDYVSSWFSLIDPGCTYNDEKAKQKDSQHQTQNSQADSRKKAMVYTLSRHRKSPLLEHMYHALIVIFGNLATRIEHNVNIFSLILLEWTQIIAHTFKVYRQLRNNVLQKNIEASAAAAAAAAAAANTATTTGGGVSGALAAVGDDNHQQTTTTRERRSFASYLHSNSNISNESNSNNNNNSEINEQERQQQQVNADKTFVSEMAITKEFLLAGKLHKAVTFGLDVPSLLFSDAKGKECGTEPGDATAASSSKNDNNENNADDANNSKVNNHNLDEEKILEERLLKSNMLKECELDYNRVLAHRICRALMPKKDFSSPVLSSLCIEIMGACVLSPIMGCFAPEYINGWIIAAMEKKETISTTDSDDQQKRSTKEVGNVEEEAGKESKSAEIKLTDVSHLDHDDLLGGVQREGLSEIYNPVLEDVDVSFAETVRVKSDDFQTSTRGSVGPNSGVVVVVDDEEIIEDVVDDINSNLAMAADQVIMQLSMALIELQKYMDFEEIREARSTNSEQVEIEWDDEGCRTAVIQLVLLIEAYLLHGRRTKAYPQKDTSFAAADEEKDDENQTTNNLEDKNPPGLENDFSQVLMEMTSDIDDFESKISDEDQSTENFSNDNNEENQELEIYEPSPTETSTLRTLIAAWLHNGRVHRIISVIAKAQRMILLPYYHPNALIRQLEHTSAIIQQLKALDGVDIFVDTVAILSSPRLRIFDPSVSTEVLPSSSATNNTGVAPERGEGVASALMGQIRFFRSTSNDNPVPNKGFSNPLLIGGGIMTETNQRYLEFHRNEAFAASLRSERERRLESWNTSLREDKEIQLVIFRTNGRTDEEQGIHKELHHIARIFYAGTNFVTIRDAARQSSSSNFNNISSATATTSLLTVETAGSRRRLEVPDDDSSFLLRAQPRTLNAVGVHRDPQNHDQSYQSFAATFEEPAILPGSNNYTGGRYVRQCLVRYYPMDRTASVSITTDSRKLDQRRSRSSLVSNSVMSASNTPFLPSDFLRKRHLCQKWVPSKGAGGARSSITSALSSVVMESTDFNLMPRTGKALDFVYRMSFFERPVIDLGGKRFICNDSSSAVGAHRADASALEITDASLSAALLMIGDDYTSLDSNSTIAGANVTAASGSDSATVTTSSDTTGRQMVEMGSDGYPIIYMKFSRKQDEKTNVEIKPYRTSFIRAALMITAARQEAQLQCLIYCVRAGSAKSATKARIDALLWPTLRLLSFATNRNRQTQTVILRDLKLGINHIDREQLRRNGLLVPRYPTIIKELSAVVEGTVLAKDINQFVSLPVGSAHTTLYKITCTAIVELIGGDTESDSETYAPYAADKSGSLSRLYRESWVVYRPFKDFQALHKHLKTQVAVAESSGTAGSRLVGAATAAFSTAAPFQVPGGQMLVGNNSARPRERKALVPSLGQANKAGGLGVTWKSADKRKDILNGYLRHILSDGHFLNRCTEILLFVGAYYPLPSNVSVSVDGVGVVTNQRDPLGRTEMLREVISTDSNGNNNVVRRSARDSASLVKVDELPSTLGPSLLKKDTSTASSVGGSGEIKASSIDITSAGTSSLSYSETTAKGSEKLTTTSESVSKGLSDENEKTKIERNIEMNPIIASKIEEVPLGLVRNRIFDVLRYQFGFDNASFLRSRMLSALKTATFAAASEFRKMLYNVHINHINPDSLAGWIEVVLNLLWPNGVFMEKAPMLTEQEMADLSQKAKETLHKEFPDQLRAILGQDLARDGLDILHEMLQNRIVVKSMAYMLFDFLWLEIFPEIQDVVTCGNALDIKNTKYSTNSND